ncbi:MAG: Ig-like domain-containing protein [Candidatus Nanohaloarchaea archaeon]|nr:Ig-like domain-containing protein [Candidatus Nanohaloarchaea archaeon]
MIPATAALALVFILLGSLAMAAAPDSSADLTMYGPGFGSPATTYSPGEKVYLELNDTDLNTSTSAETYTVGVASGTEPNVTVSGESVPSGTTTYTTARIVADNTSDGRLTATDFTLTGTGIQISSVARERNGTATLTFNTSTSGSETIDYVSFDENVTLDETTGTSASFIGSITTGTGAATANDGTLQVSGADNVTAYYPDLSATTRRVTTAYIDAEAPTITDEESINNTYVREDAIQAETFLFRINDSESGVNTGTTTLTLRFNGSEHTFTNPQDSSGAFQFDENGNDGTDYNFTLDPDDWTTYSEFSRNPQDGDVISFNASAKDNEGNSVDRNGFVSLTVDGSSPFFTQQTPSPGSMTSTDQPSIKVNISDTLAGVNASSITVTLADDTGYTYLDRVGTGDAHVTWTGDLLDIEPAASTPFTFNETGITVTVSANDTIEHTNSTTWSFTVDTTTPTNLTLHAPTSTLDVAGNEQIDVTYSYNETNPDITNITLYDGTGNNATYTVDDASYAGDESEKTATIDLSNPDGKTGNGLVHGNTYSIALLTVDEAGNTDSLDPAASNILELNNIQLDKDFYTEGDKMAITVFDNSSSGNSASGTVEYVDITANTTGTVTTETVTVEAANNASRGRGEDLKETGQNTGVFTGTIDLVAPANDGGESNGDLGVETTDTINVYTPNFAGSATATVDQEAPTGTTINTPPNTVYHTKLAAGNNTMTVNYTYTETGGGAQNVTFTLIDGGTTYEFEDSSVPGGTGTITTTGTVNFTAEDVAAGTYDLKVTVTDVSGNTNSTTVQDRVVVDNTQPTVTLRSLQGTVNVSGTLYVGPTSASRTLNATITDDGNLTSNESFTIRYNIPGAGNSTAALSNTSALGNTSVNYTADIDDTTSFNNTDTVTVWVNGSDRAGLPPDLSFTSPLATYTRDSQKPDAPTFSISGGSCSVEITVDSASDGGGSGVDEIWIYRNSSASIRDPNDRIDTVDFTEAGMRYVDNDAESGTYNYTIRAVDHLDQKRFATDYKETTVTLGNLSLEATTSFNSVDTSGSPVISNRTVTVTVTDDCSVGGSGNVISNENINFTASTDLNNVTIEPNASTTDSNGQTSFSLTAELGGGWVNITGRTTPGSTTLSDTINLYLEEYTISLKDGWNIVSTPILPKDTSIDTILQGLEGATVEQIWYYNTSSQTWLLHNPDKSSNQLENLQADRGYFMNVSGDGNLTVTGSLAEIENPSNGVESLLPSEITLYDGWNLIGFRRFMNTTKYFDKFGFSSVLTLNTQGGTSFTYVSKSASQTALGRGYWVDMNSTETFALAELRD